MNDDTVEKGKQVVNWEEELAKDAQKAAASERPRLATISLRGGVMSYEKTPIPGNKLQVIVVATTMARVFYKDRFDPNKPASPVCFAFHDGSEDVPWVPHEKVHDKQNDLCATCPRNEWGSDLNGGKGKACKETRKLALLPGAEAKEMALLSVPVTSVRNWSNYVNQIAAQAQRPPWGVITEISVHPNPKNQFEVKFEYVDGVPTEKLASVHSKIGMAMEVLVAPFDYQEPGETMADNAATAASKKKKY